MKDWTGNSKSIYTTLGASNHTDKARETNDYYATYLQYIDDKLDYEHWYMGHYHLDVTFGSDSDKQKHILYNYVDMID